jgi:GGDEF domain-containing protein
MWPHRPRARRFAAFYILAVGSRQIDPSDPLATLPPVGAGHQQRHGGLPKPDRAARRAWARAARRALLQSAVIAGATAAAVALAGGGDAFWACVPGALLAAGGTRGRVAGAVGAGAVIGAALAAELAATRDVPRPPVALLVLVPAASVAVLLAVRERLARERDVLRASALSDPLTGVANRRSLLARIDYEIARHGRSRRSFALLMLDLDGFKLLNDRFGHPAGDDLLREVAAALARAIRDQDIVARVGGDEFCVLAPETDAAGAHSVWSPGSKHRWRGSWPGSTCWARAPARRFSRTTARPRTACSTRPISASSGRNRGAGAGARLRPATAPAAA